MRDRKDTHRILLRKLTEKKVQLKAQEQLEGQYYA
jgi:hypothetical protein